MESILNSGYLRHTLVDLLAFSHDILHIQSFIHLHAPRNRNVDGKLIMSRSPS